MYEELIKALRYCDLVVNKTEDTLQCGVCQYFERCSDLDNQVADALEAQAAQFAEESDKRQILHNQIALLERDATAKDAEIERLTIKCRAAVIDLNGWCPSCKRYDVDFNEMCCKCGRGESQYEWRGICNENN